MRVSPPLVVALTLLGRASVASGQACTPPARPAFAFQVEQPAAYVGDSVLRPRPSAGRFVRVAEHPHALVVQFVVDTVGQPVVASFKVLNAPSAAIADSARAALPRWRFTPAVKSGCKVPQLVQTMIER